MASSRPSAAASALARSLYRGLLRELPPRPHHATILSHRSSIQDALREHFRADSPLSASSSAGLVDARKTEQLIKYMHAQRRYNTLVERYNPGMNMSDEERVRLTARRVGMDLPVQADQ